VTEDLVATAPDGIPLAVSVHGEGPPLLMIPGLGSARRVYDPIVPGLATRRRVIVYDPRGIGGSGISDGPYTMAQLAADAASVLDAAGEPAAAVWGASMGGMVAQHVALDHPARVSRLFLACTGPGSSHAVRADPEATRALLGKGARTLGEAYRMACTVMYTERFQRERPDVIDEQVRLREAHPVRARAFNAQYEAVRGHDTWSRLPAIAAPTLVIHGADDRVMPVGNGEVLAERIPGARLVVLPEAAHLFFHEDPDQTVALILDFLT
jgi:3-oxoadipate enol-lactonase